VKRGKEFVASTVGRKIGVLKGAGMWTPQGNTTNADLK